MQSLDSLTSQAAHPPFCAVTNTAPYYGLVRILPCFLKAAKTTSGIDVERIRWGRAHYLQLQKVLRTSLASICNKRMATKISCSLCFGEPLPKLLIFSANTASKLWQVFFLRTRCFQWSRKHSRIPPCDNSCSSTETVRLQLHRYIDRVKCLFLRCFFFAQPNFSFEDSLRHCEIYVNTPQNCFITNRILDNWKQCACCLLKSVCREIANVHTGSGNNYYSGSKQL